MADSGPATGITGLAGVIIWTEPDRLAGMLAFYRDVLGLPIRSEKPTFANFEWGGVRFSVAAHDEVTGATRDPLRVMVHFTVGDIHATFSLLRDRGVAFSRQPEQERWGGWVATFADPDGNTLQLLQLPR